MKTKDRDKILRRIFSVMYKHPDINKRYQLRQVGESVVDEYPFLKRAEVDRFITSILDGMEEVEDE